MDAEPQALLEPPEAAGPDVDWLVDAYNVIQVALLGGRDRTEWWRSPMRRKLLDCARGLPESWGRVWLVFDGPDPVPESTEDEALRGEPRIVFAPSADQWIVKRVKAGPTPCFVVTADRRVAGRARHAGAEILSPGRFVAACDHGHQERCAD